MRENERERLGKNKARFFSGDVPNLGLHLKKTSLVPNNEGD
jgi:hypothetical protein